MWKWNFIRHVEFFFWHFRCVQFTLKRSLSDTCRTLELIDRREKELHSTKIKKKRQTDRCIDGQTDRIDTRTNKTRQPENRIENPKKKSNRQIWDFGGSKHVYSLKAYYQDSENGFDGDDDDYDVSALRIGTWIAFCSSVCLSVHAWVWTLLVL